VEPTPALPIGRTEAAAADAATPSDRSERPFTPWRERRGPAYPDDDLRSFGRDAQELPATLWDDTKATFTDPFALTGLALAGAAGIVLSDSEADACVADHYREHGPQLSHCLDEIGDVGGHPGLHFALAGTMYFSSLAAADVRNYEVSKTLLNALAVNGVTTLALKGLAHTDTPNGGEHGWPSGHTSSSFALASVMHRAYGPVAGVPLYAFAGFVGYQRIDSGVHDLGDVASGALIGLAIGHAVAANHEVRVGGFAVVPWADPTTGTTGLALTRSW
jgi:hypothetical protein